MLERYNFGVIMCFFFPFHFDSDNTVTHTEKIQLNKSVYILLFFQNIQKMAKNIFADVLQYIFNQHILFIFLKIYFNFIKIF